MPASGTWIVTGALGIVAVGAGVALAANDAAEDRSVPGIEVSAPTSTEALEVRVSSAVTPVTPVTAVSAVSSPTPTASPVTVASAPTPAVSAATPAASVSSVDSAPSTGSPD